MSAHRAPISGIDAGPDGMIATAGYDNRLILWDGASRAGVAEARHDHLANQCRFSPSGRLLVSASSDYSARIWSVPSLALVASLEGHLDDVEMAVFSPDERRVATASRDHMVRIFNLKGKLLACMEGHRADVISVEWSSDGETLVSSGDDGTIRRFSTRTFNLLDTVDLGEIEADTVVCGPTGTYFAGADTGEIVTLRGGTSSRLMAHESGIKRLVYEAASRALLSAGYDRIVKLWQVAPSGALALRQAFMAPPVVWLRCAAFESASTIVFGSFGSSFARYDCDSREWDLAGIGDTHGVNAALWFDGATHTVGDAGVVRREGVPVCALGSLCNFLVAYDGRLFTGGHLGQLFDALTGDVVYRHHSPLNCAATFARGGAQHLVVGSYTGECVVFQRDAEGRLTLAEEFRPHDNAIKGLACNERFIFTVCATGAAALTAIDSFKREQHLPRAHGRISNGAARMPDGRFASVSRDRLLRIWNGAEATEVETPHSHSIKCVAVCQATGLIATAAYDGLVAVYDERTRSWIRVEQPTRAGISSISAGPQPGEFLASSYDGAVYQIAACAHPVAA
ncbi:MAG: WD40 repeat domain-containing protein [Massilia sp.]